MLIRRQDSDLLITLLAFPC